MKFRSEAPPKIRVDARCKGGDWRFSVSDNGIGIDPKFQDQIFDIFRRLHRREQYDGTGIGLAICKKIVDRHGGRIWVESQPGQGATFYFHAPHVTSRSTPSGVRSPHVLDRRGLAFRSFWTDTVVSWLCKAGGAPVGNPPMTDMPRVVLLMHPFAGYDRGLLEGIARYAQLHGPWVFCLAGEHPEVPILESDSTSDKMFPVAAAGKASAQESFSLRRLGRRRNHRPDSDARDGPNAAVVQTAGDCS